MNSVWQFFITHLTVIMLVWVNVCQAEKFLNLRILIKKINLHLEEIENLFVYHSRLLLGFFPNIVKLTIFRNVCFSFPPFFLLFPPFFLLFPPLLFRTLNIGLTIIFFLSALSEMSLHLALSYLILLLNDILACAFNCPFQDFPLVTGFASIKIYSRI